MRWSKSLSLLILVLLAAASIVLVGGCSKPAPKPLPEQPAVPDNQQLIPSAPPVRMIIGYFEEPTATAPDKTNSFPSMKTFARSMTHVAPFRYKITISGTLEVQDSQLVYDSARQLGLKMFALITLKNDAAVGILDDPALRTKAIDNIVKVVVERPFEGVTVSLVGLQPAQQQNFTAFMAELYAKLKTQNKTVLVAVPPKIDVPEKIHGAYNYSGLAKNADYLQIMLFDRHSPDTEPGAVAPVGWYERNLQHAIEQGGGAQKIIAALNTYGYDWTAGSAKVVKYVDAIVLAQKHGAHIEYDEQSQAPYFKFLEHEVWYENEKSSAAKLDVIAKYNPAGIALWQLGQEQPEIWPLIEQKFPKQ